jgi:DNA polymerase III subunit gamma/tau
VSYQVIARKFRPQVFGGVIGQNHVTQTLQNSLKNNRLPHALLFTGPRGTGKTSSARILAKALRCPNSVDFNPCGTCDSCVEIAEGRSVNVIEIDGASNNGVDAIRELRDTVSYMPTSGKYKIYIIDEVHMLSTSAFNALLKTLEEPPAHVIFIMATTEVHKIPQTILSRCQRFDFRRISTRQIVEHLKTICASEKVDFEEEALWTIARQGDGSMRDAQTLLDQVISFANGKLTAFGVADILGLTDRTLLLATLKSLVDGDTLTMIEILKKLNFSGTYPELFARELLESIRTLTLVKVAGAKLEILDRPDSEINSMVSMSTHVSEESLQFLFDMAFKTAGDVAKSSDPQIVLEMGLLRMVQAPKLVDLKKLLSGQAMALPASHPAKSSATTAKTIPLAGNPAPQSITQTSTVPQKFLKAKSPAEKWLLFVNSIRSRDAIFAAKVENFLFVSEENRILKLSISAKHMFLADTLKEPESRLKLQSFLDSLWGEDYTFQVVAAQKAEAAESAQKMAQKKAAVDEKNVEEQLKNHPSVQAAQKVFKGDVKAVPDRNRR